MVTVQAVVSVVASLPHAAVTGIHVISAVMGIHVSSGISRLPYESAGAAIVDCLIMVPVALVASIVVWLGFVLCNVFVAPYVAVRSTFAGAYVGENRGFSAAIRDGVPL